jgi:pilus assembly protein CpaC
MRDSVGLFRTLVLVALMGLLAPALFSDMPVAAESKPGNAKPFDATGNPDKHQSIIHIDESGGTPIHKNIKVGMGKSVLLEFPRDIRDVMVSNPQALDAVVLSTNKVFLLAKKLGEANAFFFDSTGEQYATLEIFVERETSGLENVLNRLIAGANVKVELINQTAVLTGTVKSPSDSVRAANIARQFVATDYESTSVEKLDGVTVAKTTKAPDEMVINMLVVEAEEQVMLKVVVAEVQRSLLKQMGVNLGATITAGNFSTALLTENALPLTAAAGLGKLPIPGFNLKEDNTQACGVAGQLCNYNTGPTASSYGNSGLSGAWGSGGNQITHAIRALERDGLVRTLAEPNLTAVSGEPAKFLAGGEYPVPVVDTLGGLSVTYKEFGVGLAFTPIVLSEGRISLKIETEVSELSSDGAVTLSGIQIPALKKRVAKSTVELPSGGTLAMAGLISDDTRQNIDGLPGAKDIPILGSLFRSRDFIKNETELIVMVTPYLVHPTSRQQLATPTDGLAAENDLKANFLGQLNKVYGRKESQPVGDLKGDYGFIVE